MPQCKQLLLHPSAAGRHPHRRAGNARQCGRVGRCEYGDYHCFTARTGLSTGLPGMLNRAAIVFGSALHDVELRLDPGAIGGGVAATGGDSGLFEQSLPAALGIGVGGGVVLLLLSGAIAINWHGWAEKYTDMTDRWWPRWSRPSRVVRERTHRLTFALFAPFGVVLIVTGSIAALHH